MKAFTPCRTLTAGLALLALAACTHHTETATTTTPRVPGKPAVPQAPQQPGTTAEQPRAAAPVTRAVAPGRRVSRVEVPGNYVALTFDDGPSATLTPKVLDILKRHNAHGTFFMLGENVNRNSSIVARAAAEGNEVGVHTWSHIKMTGSSAEKIDSEISRTRNAIQAATGSAPVVMRPPYGAVNADIVNSMYDTYGMSTILWDVDTRDWQHPGVDVVVNRAVGGARSGSIILVHDIHASTLAALEGIVTGLQARGFKLVTVSQLMALAKRASANPALAQAMGSNTGSGPVSVPGAAQQLPDIPAPRLVQRSVHPAATGAAGIGSAPVQDAPAAPVQAGGASAISGQ